MEILIRRELGVKSGAWGIAHVMIVEVDLLLGALENFDLIVLPYIPLINYEKQPALKRYVDNGRKLLIIGNCGM